MMKAAKVRSSSVFPKDSALEDVRMLYKPQLQILMGRAANCYYGYEFFSTGGSQGGNFYRYRTTGMHRGVSPEAIAAQAAASVAHSLPMTLQAISRPRMKAGSLNPGRRVRQERSSETTRRAATAAVRKAPTVKRAGRLYL
jgi:hypothetical protein